MASGLDKLINSILEDGQKAADDILQKASVEAKNMKNKYEEKAEEEMRQALNSAQVRSQNFIKKEMLLAETQKKCSVLAAKNQIIEQIINEAKKSLLSLPQNDYFELLCGIIKKFALPQQEGEIILSPKDSELYAEKLVERVNNLKISPQTREIDGGLILRYQNVEQNCSFKALFENSYNEICDFINKEISV